MLLASSRILVTTLIALGLTSFAPASHAKNDQASASLVPVMSLLLGEDSSSGSGLSIFGIVAESVPISRLEKTLQSVISEAYALSGVPDQVVVMFNGGRDQQSFPIDATGHFEIDTQLLSGNDLVILVVDSSTKEVFGHLNIQSNSGHELDQIDTSLMDESIDMGIVSTATGLTSATNLDSTTSFNLATTVMEDIARTDDGVILSVNRYTNPEYITEVHAIFNMQDIDDIKNTFSDLDAFTPSSLREIRPTVVTTTNDWSGITEADIELYSPTNWVNNNGDSKDASMPLSGTYYDSSFGGQPDWQFYEFEGIESFPEGDWLLKKSSSTDTEATFIYSATNPFNASDEIQVPAPELRVNITGTTISSIDVRWRIYDESTLSYKLAAEELMTSLASQDHDGDNIEFALRTNMGNTIEIFTNSSWSGNFLSKSGSLSTLPASQRRFNIGYSIGQVSYQYLFE